MVGWTSFNNLHPQGIFATAHTDPYLIGNTNNYHWNTQFIMHTWRYTNNEVASSNWTFTQLSN